jgi:hypothetical protein
MRKNLLPIGICLAFTVIFLTSLAFSADLYLKQQQHIDAVTMMGQTQPERTIVSEIWMTPTRTVMSSNESKTVLDFEAKTVSIADHKKKTIMQMPLDFSKMADRTGDMSEKDKVEFQKMMGKMMDIKVSVQPTNEKKKIRQWQCQKYLQTVEMAMGKITSEIWATPEITIDYDLYAKYTAAMLASMPGMNQNLGAVANEMKKIKGVQVYTVQKTEMMGKTFGSTVELLEYKEGKAPADAFDMPKDYKKQNMQ